MAFGDSITGGVLEVDCGPNGPQCSTVPGATVDQALRVRSLLDDLRLLRLNQEYSTAAYPRQLTTLLTTKYSTQSIAMANEGIGGEEVTTSETFDRFRAALDTLRPEVVLLQEGVNDLHHYGGSAVPVIAGALREMVILARSRGIHVYVGTLLPERECACRAYAPSLIAPANDQIRAMAAAEGALLVDLHQAFGGQTSTLLGIDGLHPNEAGYQRMASTFFDAIQATLEMR
jgi:lysophospholipase L1-like esterase